MLFMSGSICNSIPRLTLKHCFKGKFFSILVSILILTAMYSPLHSSANQKKPVPKKNESLKVSYEKALEYYRLNALNLANDELSRAIKNPGILYNFSDSMFMGKIWQLKSHLCYDLGYVAETQFAIDSMYAWKSKTEKHEVLYAAEYYAYLCRFFARELKQEHSEMALQNALNIIKNHPKSTKISYHYIAFNALNVYRNNFELADSLNYLNGAFRYTADSLITEAMASNDPWYMKKFYMRVRANVWQDFLIQNASQQKKQLIFPLVIQRIDEARDFLLKELKQEGIHSLTLLNLKGLQYTYLDSFVQAGKIFQQVSEHLQITIDNKTDYQSLLLPLMHIKWKIINELMISQNEYNEGKLIDLLNQMLESEDLYTQYLIHYLKSSPEYIAGGYSKNPFDEIISISAELYRLTKKEEYLILYWNYTNKKHGNSLLLKLLEIHFPNELKVLMNKADSVYHLQNIKLDQFYLAKAGYAFADTSSLKREILKLQQESKSILNHPNKLIRAYFGREAAVSFYQYRAKLKKDEAMIIYDHNRLNGKLNYAMVLTTQLQEIIKLPSDSFTKIHFLNEKLYASPEAFQNLSSIYSEIYYYPLAHLLKDIKKIEIIRSTSIEFLPFDILIEQKLDYPSFHRFNYLGKKYQFRYISNINEELFQNSEKWADSDTVLLISPRYYDDKVRWQLPFNYQLAEGLTEGSNCIVLRTFRDFEELSGKEHRFNFIHIAAHGQNELSKKFTHSPIEKDYTLWLEDSAINWQVFYGLKLKSNLAIISSCYSGMAMRDPGEGQIGLNRALRLAGVKAIVNTPWRLDDQSSAVILEHFYKNLYKGMPASEALWKAKQSYLAGVNDPSGYNPLFWAGLSYQGPEVSIKGKKSNMLLIVTSLFLTILILFYIFRRIKFARSEKLLRGSEAI